MLSLRMQDKSIHDPVFLISLSSCITLAMLSFLSLLLSLEKRRIIQSKKSSKDNKHAKVSQETALVIFTLPSCVLCYTHMDLSLDNITLAYKSLLFID